MLSWWGLFLFSSDNDLETNLKSHGYDLRDNGNGHWILPNGKGISPSSKHGIMNHWDTVGHSGLVPYETARNHPIEAVNTALKHSWLRRTGWSEPAYESWGLPEHHKKIIEDDLVRTHSQAVEPEENHVFLDVSKKDGTGRGYHRFTLKDFEDHGFSLNKTLKRHPMTPSEDQSKQKTLD